MKPILSICIPTHNRAQFLKETLESIISQANDDIELVVSDNASTDSTLDVVQSFKHKHLVYFRHPENVGADLNYLKAAELASGQYCWLFGSDDIMQPGAISLVLSQLSSGLDIYLGGFTLCTKDMRPITKHHIIKTNGKTVFDLSNDADRLDYFRHSMTTTAFFSFLGSIIVRREKWNRAALDPVFIGSLWAHVGKCFGILPCGLKLKFIEQSLLLKRGDNDSFMDRGLVHRIGVSINGYLMIGRSFFGDNSPEQQEIKRVLRYEWPLIVYVCLRDNLQSSETEAKENLDQIFSACFDSGDLRGYLSRLAYKFSVGRTFYRTLHRLAMRAKGWANG